MPAQRPDEDDRSLLERIERGDEPAFSLLYDLYASVIYSIAVRVLRDPGLAEKMVSEAFIEIWRQPGRFMGIKGSLTCAMVLMARNRAVAMLLGKPAPDFDGALPHWVLNQDRTMTREEACAAIDQLPGEQRVMLEKAFFEGTTKSALSKSTKAPGAMDERLVTESAVSKLAGTGLEVIDLKSDPAFARRQLHVRDVVAHIDGMNRLARVFAENSANILQELVTAAVDLCGADSAGISVVQENSTDESYYHWVATAGQYSGFLDARLPRYPSACGVTLERGRPQIFRVTQRFFDLMGVQAPTVTDGLLLPWQVGETRGTIWIMAHGRDEAFDKEDCRIMEALAKFAATGVGLQQQQRLVVEQARTAAEAAMANSLAHQIIEPVQGLMLHVSLFREGGAQSQAVAQQAMGDVLRLSDLVKELLTFPKAG